jgi:hypothetical protein
MAEDSPTRRRRRWRDEELLLLVPLVASGFCTLLLAMLVAVATPLFVAPAIALSPLTASATLTATNTPAPQLPTANPANLSTDTPTNTPTTTPTGTPSSIGTMTSTTTGTPSSTSTLTSTPTGTPTNALLRVPTAAPPPNQLPIVDGFFAQFSQGARSTFYKVAAHDPDGDPLKYTWSLANTEGQGGSPCGEFHVVQKLQDLIGNPFDNQIVDYLAVWHHPDVPGGCPVEKTHPGTITVVIDDGRGGLITCNYLNGSANGNSVDNPKSMRCVH